MEKMVNKWLANGTINPETAAILLEDIKNEKSKKHRIRINILIYTIAAIFIGIGVISFIAANDWLLKLFNQLTIMQIVCIATFTIASLFFGYKLAYENNKFPKLGHSLIFLSTILIGGTYALIGQIYNINANNSSLMFLWLISILPVAYIFKNFAINIVSIMLFILGIIFYYMDLGLDQNLTWTIYIPIILGTALYTFGNIQAVVEKYNKFSLSYKLTGLATIFVTLLILICSVEHSYQQISPYYIIPLAILIIGNYINYITAKGANNLLKIETIFITGLLLGLLIMIVLPEVSVPCVMFIANISIITMISAGYNYGYKFENSSIIGLTNWFLITYLTINYCRWGWNYMEKATFFILGGIGLLAIGMFLENKRKNLIKKEK